MTWTLFTSSPPFSSLSSKTVTLSRLNSCWIRIYDRDVVPKVCVCVCVKGRVCGRGDWPAGSEVPEGA